MLLTYFLKRFFLVFILSLAGLIPIFASADMIIRLAALPFSGGFLKLFILMLPLVSVFAIPIATCLAVGVTVGNLFTYDEVLILHFFESAKRALIRATLFFSLFLGVLYLPIVFELGPTSYWRGKQFLLKEVRQEIENLPAQQFHTIASRCAIFFQKKTSHGGHGIKFESIILMLKEKEGKQYIVTAKEGSFSNGILSLNQGTVYSQNDKKQTEHYLLQFKILEMNINQLFFNVSDNNFNRPIKFLSFSQLYSRSFHNLDVYREWHKRLMQLLWQLLLPFLMLFAMMSFARQKSNLLLSVSITGLLFLVSYITSNMAYFFLTRTWWSISIFYAVPIFLASGLYWFYRRRT